MYQTAVSVNEELQELKREVYSDPDVLQVITDSIIEHERGSVKGLKIGDVAPDFTLPNNKRGYVSLYEELAKGPVALVFFRGEWCPYCSLELRSLQEINSDVKELGAQIITVHPQDLSVSRNVAIKYQLGYQVLSDVTQQVIEDYKIKYSIGDAVKKLFLDTFNLDLEKANANGMWNLPVPASFIIDRDGTIKARHFSHDYTYRIEPSDILTALKALPMVSQEFVY
jgi:peroxiredoxin